MVFKYFPNIKKETGTTLIELLVVLAIIVLLAMILVVNFPEIQKRLALSRVTYKLAQDLRKTEDLALSGIQLKDKNGNHINAQGYGVYIPDTAAGDTTQYVIYAYLKDQDKNYNGDSDFSLCSKVDLSNWDRDCAIEVVDISEDNPNLRILGFKDLKYRLFDDMGNTQKENVSISFIPPNPTVAMESTLIYTNTVYGSGVGIIIDDGSGHTRMVIVEKTGLINVK